MGVGEIRGFGTHLWFSIGFFIFQCQLLIFFLMQIF